MAKLEELTIGTSISGLGGNSSAIVVAVKWYGDNVIELTLKDKQGNLSNQLLYREDENRFQISEANAPWSFDADADQMRLASEAYRIKLAHLFDPYLAVHSSAIEPLPHQISAVYQEMLPRLPLRYVLADDPGAGKTIMTGLYIKELIIRGELKRCLIVCPGSLAEQWQDELYRKFNLHFEIITNDKIESAVSGNVFNEVNLAIARLDKLARNDDLQDKLKITDWDLVVCDEAHKMSATVFGLEVKKTKRFVLGQLLSNICRHFLLLTATPHNGKEQDFQLFMSLIDQDRFEDSSRTSQQSVDVSDCMRRLVKEELLKFDGKPLFPERRAYTVNYSLSNREALLYEAVTNYVQDEFNRADQLSSDRRTTVGFALTILQRRLASSPEAIYQSLRRRKKRLEERLNEEKLGKRAAEYLFDALEDYDDEDLPSVELEDTEEQLVDQSTAAQTIAELEIEIKTLQKLENMADDVRKSGEDRKWDELSHLLQDDQNMFSADGMREKLIIFTEHRDTLQYLASKTRSLLGDEEAVVTLHGGLLRDERRKIEEKFKQDSHVRILIATDAAGEGINLQRAHLMVNYDLPWNPNRLEQRFGRIHRIGQTEVCHLWNLVSKETREGAVYQRLLEKLDQERESLQGKVFDVLGDLTFDNKPLRLLLIEAIRYGNDPEVRDRLNQVVDRSINSDALKKLIDENVLTEDTMNFQQVMNIREEMERLEAHKLQPHFIEAFFMEAFNRLGGVIKPRENGRFEILQVPASVRNRDRIIGFGEPVLKRYERICFDNAFINLPGQPQAALITPGHPLLEAILDIVREQSRDLLKHGTIFIDENDYSNQARLLFYIEDAVKDGVRLPNGNQRIVSRALHFVEINENGQAANAGLAPYLDYRSPTENELTLLRPYLKEQDWLKQDVENLALHYAITEVIPPHIRSVSERRVKQIDKIANAVKFRLNDLINYWAFRAMDLKANEEAGKVNAKLNSQQANQRAEDLEGRLKKRMEELDQERQISAVPPLVSGGAMVIPVGLLRELSGEEDLFSKDAQARKFIEMAAMEAVMEIEKNLGYSPKDVSQSKCGYDIESWVPPELRDSEGRSLRFIEVKGRTSEANTVTVSKNEILTAFNKPEEYILAIVLVDDGVQKCSYLQEPFREKPDFAATSINYDLRELRAQAKIILEREK